MRHVSPRIIVETRPHTRPTRLGITITKKCGSAVCRNRFKRIVRAAFREILPYIPTGLDIHVSPRRGFEHLTSGDIYRELKTVCKVTA